METGRVVIGAAGAGLIALGLYKLFAKPSVEKPAVEVGLTWD